MEKDSKGNIRISVPRFLKRKGGKQPESATSLRSVHYLWLGRVERSSEIIGRKSVCVVVAHSVSLKWGRRLILKPTEG